MKLIVNDFKDKNPVRDDLFVTPDVVLLSKAKKDKSGDNKTKNKIVP